MSAEISKKFPFLVEMGKGHKGFVGRETELDYLKETLYKKRMRNLILTGFAGVGKTALVEEVARQMKKECRFYELNVALTVSDTQFRGDFEKKIFDSFAAIKKEETLSEKKIVLFIDEVHMICGAGATSDTGQGDYLDMANILKPKLSSGELTVWGATTSNEYKMSIAKDPALARRFSMVYIPELREEETLKAVMEFVDHRLQERTVQAIYDTAKTIEGGHMPDVAIELADRAMARCAYRKCGVTQKMLNQIALAMSGLADVDAL